MDVTTMKSRLSAYGLEIQSSLKAFIPDKEPKKYLYDLVTDYPERGGKGFRPALCLASCKAFGGSYRDAAFSAMALEMLHNAFLIHDDVEDESFFRRNKPTMHQATSQAIAINVGDAMNALSLYPLWCNMDRLGNRLSKQIFLEVRHLVLETAEGQAMELGWRKDNEWNLTESDYLRMILKKTCWYTCIHPIRIGAIIGSGGKMAPESFDRLGYFMGAAFQIQDDLLNLVGDEALYGKEIGGDIIEGKRTLMLIYLMTVCSPDKKEFVMHFLEKPIYERQHENAEIILQWMHELGAIDYAKKTSKYLAGAALKEFYTHFSHLPSSDDKSFIESLIIYMINRKY